ncbi:PilZ domain-containing protein [Shewanella sp. C32]|uniref:PilZ domain-containing protein n=1 Tax=Shewanella electrica TaxID=515560 RepID=A0ABT2FHD6_9GAMM|nr:PilZ domain-containing protein [Shewanella electrica]MCH1923269.1 PilZ domain-containing protein [Shewanella electrica]MCS4555366.1 PilZ domain-containing protein [Shewanella electrica]
MSANQDNARIYKRHALSRELVPEELQHDGIAVRLHWPLIIKWFGCNAIMKDVGLGGTGLLVPVDKKVPSRIVVEIDETVSLKGKVVHRRQISEKLMFLGVDWRREPDSKRRRMLKLVALLNPHVQSNTNKRNQGVQQESLLE